MQSKYHRNVVHRGVELLLLVSMLFLLVIPKSLLILKEFLYMYTVESLLKDAPYKGHKSNYLPIRDKVYSPNLLCQCVSTSVRGQPPYKGQRPGSQAILYLEIPLATCVMCRVGLVECDHGTAVVIAFIVT